MRILILKKKKKKNSKPIDRNFWFLVNIFVFSAFNLFV